ncbi:MAG: ABC transporter ATP-binding protein [Candidatus Bathyarchaeota archaeon]|jgi:ABC-type Fe3+/spermidine/putrescine transport system ATPase subunit
MVEVVLKGITKKFGDVVAAGDVNLKIEDGEFFTFLGPSGCGKTTTMRIVAGLEYPDEGRVYFGGKDVTELPPYSRNTGMVFQNYALWPHMKVYENVAYGLKVRKVDSGEIKKRVTESLEMVKLGGLEERFPNQLSGGQQQRVALARVLVINPDLLLLDEPLSNLDAKLRVEMREEIKELQRELGITTIYVTHDQEEAMVISDRIAIQNFGVIKQVGSPTEIYRRPNNLFIATFIGRGTLLHGKIEATGTPMQMKAGELTLKGDPSKPDMTFETGDKVACVLRPESFEVKPPEEPYNTLEGIIEWGAFVGSHTEVRIDAKGHKLIVDVPPEIDCPIGKILRVYIPHADTILLPLE